MVRGLVGIKREARSICTCTHWYDEEQRATYIASLFLERRWL